MKYRSALTLLAVCLGAGAVRAADNYSDKFYDLLRLLPESVNAVVVSDVEALYKSRLAAREGWQTTNPLPAFPPRLRAAVLGAKFDPVALRSGVWEVGAAWLRERVSMPGLAKQERGSSDTIGGLEVVLSSRNVYFVEFTPFLVGLMRPANRQELAGWVRFAKGNPKVTLAPFLRDSILKMGKDSQVLLALNLEDVASPEVIRRKLAGSKTVADKKANVDELARVMAAIKGIKMLVHVDERIAGELVVEFGETADALAPLAHPLLLEILASRGAAIADLEGWKVRAEGRLIAFHGPLTATGFRQVMSLIQLPPLSMESESAASPQLAQEIKTLASKRYLQTVVTFLDDLKKPNKQLKNYQDVALWYDKYANRIENLPVDNVDEELVKYGADVANKLRGIGASLRGELVRVSNLEGAKVLMVQATPGWWGWGSSVGIHSNVGEVNVKQAEAAAKGAETRLEIWRLLDQETTSVRARMSAKLKTDF